MDVANDTAQKAELLATLERCGWNLLKASRVLVLDPKTVRSRLRRFGIERKHPDISALKRSAVLTRWSATSARERKAVGRKLTLARRRARRLRQAAQRLPKTA